MGTDKRSFRMMIAVFLMMSVFMLMHTAAVFAYDENTDTDEDMEDGSYTFTGDGDWYGYTSYLHYDREVENPVAARYYYITLPEDGRLDIELTGEQNVYFLVMVRQWQGDVNTFDNEWRPSNLEGPLSFRSTTEIMEKGTYTVTFGYDLSTYLGPLQTWPEKHYFYHNLTFHKLNSDEAKALEVIKKINALPKSVAIEDKAAVEAAKAAYDSLTDAQKACVGSSTKDTLDSDISTIEYLEKQAEEEKKPEDQSGSSVPPAVPDGSGDSSNTPGSSDDSGYTPEDDWYEEPVTKPAKGAFSSVKPAKKKIKVSIRPQSSARYQLAIRQKGKKKWKTVSLSRTSYTFRKLKSRKKYQIRVRAIKTINGYKYTGAWSKIKTVKVK